MFLAHKQGVAERFLFLTRFKWCGKNEFENEISIKLFTASFLRQIQNMKIRKILNNYRAPHTHVNNRKRR